MPGPAPTREPMPCPGKLKNGQRCGNNVGNNRATCSVCNRFAQRVERATTRAFKQSYPKAYAKIRNHLEARLYQDLMAQAARYEGRHPSE